MASSAESHVLDDHWTVVTADGAWSAHFEHTVLFTDEGTVVSTVPEPVIVGNTLVIATGSHGKFVSRLDLDVRDGGVQGYGYRLIPIFSDVITPDADMAALIEGFDIERFGSAPTKFDVQDLFPLTGRYLQTRTAEDVAETIAIGNEYDWHRDPNWDPCSSLAGLS